MVTVMMSERYVPNRFCRDELLDPRNYTIASGNRERCVDYEHVVGELDRKRVIVRPGDVLQQVHTFAEFLGLRFEGRCRLTRIGPGCVDLQSPPGRSWKRLAILQWLKEPKRHFRPQVYGDLLKDGVCGLFIAEKLGVSPPTASQHLALLTQAGLIVPKKIRQWTFYKRNEPRIRELKRELRDV